MMTKKKQGGRKPVFIPSPEEIRLGCLLAQERWSPAHEQNHIVGAQDKTIHADTETYHIVWGKGEI